MKIDAGVLWRALVVLDQRASSSSSTGRFELIYRATTNPHTRGVDCKFVVEGQRLSKTDLQRYVAIDRRLMRQQHLHQQVLASRDGTGSHFVTQRPSNPVIQRP